MGKSEINGQAIPGPMEIILNSYSVLKFHGPLTIEEIKDHLDNRGVYSIATEIKEALGLDAAEYFFIRKSTNCKNVWETSR